MFGYVWFQNVILTILALIVLVICGWCIYAFIRAIFLFIFSQGDNEKITAAWNSIRYMIIGIIFTISLLFVFQYLFKWMHVPGYELYSAKNIFTKAWDLLASLLEFFELYTDKWGSVSAGTQSSGKYDL